MPSPGQTPDQFPDRFPDQFPNQLPDYPITRLPDSRRASEIGRRARLELVFSYRRGRTLLSHAYAEPPFRVGALFEAGSMASMTLVYCAPGVFPGDRLEQRVRVERGARVW